MTIRNCAFLALVGLLAACSSSTGGGNGNANGGLPGQNPSGGQNFCTTACQKINQCDASQDISTCSADCTNDMAVVGPKLRADYVSRISSCYAAKDCATVLSGGADSACVDEAKAALAPSQVGTAFCNGFASAAQKCDGSVDMAECLSAAKIYNDAALTAAQACLSKACTDVQGCVNAQLGIQTSTPTGDNSCTYAFDGMCDEPDYCEYGTDTYDCS